MIELELEGRRRQVTLRRENDHWTVKIDDREVAVSVVETGGPGRRGEGGRWSMLIGPKSYDIAFEPTARGELLVHVSGVVVPITVPDRRRRGRIGRVDRDGDVRPQTIVAPMPGRIVNVLVQPGEAVQARQGLVVVEAMKMENELRAPRAGIVAEVRVREGLSVEANAVLVVLT